MTVTTRSPRGTMELAARIGRALSKGCVFALAGELGSGKTCFAKGVARGLGIDPREVVSPTFLLLHELPGRLPFCHVDAYRVRDPEELVEIGLLDYRGGEAVVLVEWADRVRSVLPPASRDVEFTVTGETSRTLRFRARGEPVPPWFSLLAGEPDR